MDRVCSGPRDEAYFRETSKIGRIHVRIGLPQRIPASGNAIQVVGMPLRIDPFDEWGRRTFAMSGQRGKTPAFAVGPFDATDAVVPSRLRDEYELRLVPRPHGTVVPPVPASSAFPASE